MSEEKISDYRGGDELKRITTNCSKCKHEFQYRIYISDIDFSDARIMDKMQEILLQKMVEDRKFYLEFMEDLANEFYGKGVNDYC